MRRHVHSGNHAAEGFVSFIPLFGGALPTEARLATWPQYRCHGDRTEVEPHAECRMTHEALQPGLYRFRVLEEATPSPNEGCMMKNGNATVMMPKMSGGSTVG